MNIATLIIIIFVGISPSKGNDTYGIIKAQTNEQYVLFRHPWEDIKYVECTLVYTEKDDTFIFGKKEKADNYGFYITPLEEGSANVKYACFGHN